MSSTGSESISGSDKVIILGAGASAGAGIPMLGTFMDTMWQLAKTQRCEGKELSQVDIEVLEQALKVRAELDGYHGRATLDVWNLEDILSILSFNALAGGENERNRLSWMTKAIARVIELTCRVRHDGDLESAHPMGTPSVVSHK